MFNKLFNKNTNSLNEPEKKSGLFMIPLTGINEIENIKESSKTEPILIFKHSSRCGISSMVLRQFQGILNNEDKDLKVYILDLLNYRDISNQLASEFQVMHQSPQLLVIKNGVAVHYASHYDILETNFSRFH